MRNLRAIANAQHIPQENQAHNSKHLFSASSTKQSDAAQDITFLNTFTLNPAQNANSTPQGNLPPPIAPLAPLTAKLQNGHLSFVSQVEKTVGASLKQNSESSIDNLNAQNLTAYCLKLDVENPSNCVETHNALSQANSDLRQAEIEKAKQQNIEAQKKLKEAEELAEKMEIFSLVMTVVCIALLVCSLGVALPGIMAGAGAVEGVGEAEKAKIMAQAHEHELYAKIHEANADRAQDMIENEAEENKVIMESVNTAFTKAIDSLSRTHAATTKLNTSTKV